jgi:hypothetical protein
VLVVGDQIVLDAVVGEQAAGAPGVLAGDEVRLAQDAQSPEGDVFEVADRGRHDYEYHALALQHVLPGGGVAGERRGPEHSRFRAERRLLDLDQVARRRAGAQTHLLAGGLED